MWLVWDRCRDWMGQARDKMSDIEASLDKMRGWVEDERTKLRWLRSVNLYSLDSAGWRVPRRGAAPAPRRSLR